MREWKGPGAVGFFFRWHMETTKPTQTRSTDHLAGGRANITMFPLIGQPAQNCEKQGLKILDALWHETVEVAGSKKPKEYVDIWEDN